jgi:hypothetical protein
VTDREVRHFAIYAGDRLALVVRDNPGTLRSTAGPAPAAGDPGPPGSPRTYRPPPGAHPFIDAQAHDPAAECRLRELLDASSSFDDYLARLLDAGFDIASCRPERGLEYELPGGRRLYDGTELAGACWPTRGQFTTLRRQPAGDELAFDVATATAYRDAAAPRLLEALVASGTFDELLERLAAAGLNTG